MKILLRIAFSCVIVFLAIIISLVFVYRNKSELPPPTYIAHGAGAIDGYKYTNTLEALQNAIDKGCKYIEFDLNFTSDSVLVAVHDWVGFKKMIWADSIDSEPMAFNDFNSSLVYGRYHTLSASMIDSIFRENPELTLVTDRIGDIDVIKRNFPSLKGRIMIECIEYDDFDRLANSDYAVRMRSNTYGLCWYGIRKFIGINVNYFNLRDPKANRSASSFIINKILNYPTAVFCNDTLVTVQIADSIMKENPYIRYVYVDEL